MKMHLIGWTTDNASNYLELFTNEGFHQSVTKPTSPTESSKTLIDHV